MNADYKTAINTKIITLYRGFGCRITHEKMKLSRKTVMQLAILPRTHYTAQLLDIEKKPKASQSHL